MKSISSPELFHGRALQTAKELLQQKTCFKTSTISDYLFTKCLLFAKVNLPMMSSGSTSGCLKSSTRS